MAKFKAEGRITAAGARIDKPLVFFLKGKGITYDLEIENIVFTSELTKHFGLKIPSELKGKKIKITVY
tara:strand:+ start:378 stop:581 length:204 start_codon:yes stop_codon:yes gene_type:complete